MRFNEKALLEAGKALRRVRIETVYGRKDRPARTIASVFDAYYSDTRCSEFSAFVVKEAVKAYEKARAALESQS